MAAVVAGALRCFRVAREEEPVTTGPEEERAAAVGGRGHLRASRTDRERVIELLKAAFVEERLDKDEFDARVVQTFASRTYAELAAVTADIAADLPVVGVAAVESAAAVPAAVGPTSTPARTLAKAAFRACLCPGPTLPDRTHPDRTRTDLRIRRPHAGRPHLSGRSSRAPRGIQPVPDAA
jgi:hypothetical protein